jgi:hypothetical protein
MKIFVQFKVKGFSFGGYAEYIRPLSGNNTEPDWRLFNYGFRISQMYK